MGWGTFAAGQALRVAGQWSRAINANADSPFFEEILYWLNNKFLQSYIRRVLQGTVIMHPSVWNSVDLHYWEESITKRAAKDWRLLVFVQIVVLAVGFSTFWPLVFLYIPGFWYYGKSQAVKRYSAEINKEFSAEGFDIPKLMLETPSLLEKERLAEQERVKKALQRQENKDYKRKFGKKKS